MPKRVVDNVDLGNVLRCSYCGRDPEILTGYRALYSRDLYSNDGPFVIKCWCGATDAEQAEYWDCWNPRHYPAIPATVRASLQFYRSWCKTRAVRGWNELQRIAREECE